MKSLIKLAMITVLVNAVYAADVQNSWCKPEVVTPVVEKTPQPPQEELLTIAVDALFAFDSAEFADVLTTSKAELNKMVDYLLEKELSIASINIVGHTDRLGSEQYNYRLGLAHANSIKNYLSSNGITAPIFTSSMGKTQPVTQNCSGKGQELKDCLQPDRRIELKVIYK